MTPYYIEALTSNDEGDVCFGTYGLYSATTHQGSVYKSAFMAIPFLVDLLRLPGEAADRACHFLARIALGEPHFISAPSEVYHTKYFRSVNKYRKDILAFYQRTRSEEALRLLCFLPGMLPDRIDFSYETSLEYAGNARLAYPRQASTLIAQGFLAAKGNFHGEGNPPDASALDPSSRGVTGHIPEARMLMETSPSLLVRGCAAICLAYTGIVDAEILDLLAYLGEQELCDVPWAWDDFSDVCRKAWMFSADLDTLMESDHFLTLDYTSYTKEGVAIPHYSPSERLTTVVKRLFPEKYTKQGQHLPLLPSKLDAMQKKALRRMVEAAPMLLGCYDTAYLNIPTSLWAAKRTLGESDELLCREIWGIPLWYQLEQCVLLNTPAEAGSALSKVDVWQLLSEIYRPLQEAGAEEKCTLSLGHYFDQKKTAERECILQSLLADGLVGYQKQILTFLDEWLAKSRTFVEYDWKTKGPGQRIGISMLALARAGKWDQKYDSLARPYHPTACFSSFPTPLLQEVLEHTSPAHKSQIVQQFSLF